MLVEATTLTLERSQDQIRTTRIPLSHRVVQYRLLALAPRQGLGPGLRFSLRLASGPRIQRRSVLLLQPSPVLLKQLQPA
jgi:hypothetical protein